MKTFYSRLVVTYAISVSILLTGIGIVLGQFFPLFVKELSQPILVKFWIFLIIILLFSFFLSIVFASRFFKKFAQPVDAVTQMATRVAHGDFQSRIPLHHPEFDNALTQAINTIAGNMQEISTLRAMEKERLKTLVESMGSALLMFGREGSVNLVNGVFLDTFELENDQVIGKTFMKIGLPTEIEKLIEQVFMTEQVHEKQVRISKQQSTSFVNVYGAPVIGHYGNWLGIVVVMHDITKLVHLEEIRKDFVANVSHELRTPITSLKGFTETLLEGAMNDPIVRKDFLEIIHSESNRLQILVDDLLDLSVIERDEFSLKYEEVNVRELIEKAISVVHGKVEQKKMNIIISGPDECYLECDADRLMQILVNLLSNAINYSLESKSIHITLEELNDELKIVVEDEGYGIDQSEIPRLFERFYRVDRARSRDSGGTGLGLAIVKHLVEAHKGSIEVQSTIGKGTIFEIRLPIQH